MTVSFAALAAAHTVHCVRIEFAKKKPARIDYLLNTHQSCAAAAATLQKKLAIINDVQM